MIKKAMFVVLAAGIFAAGAVAGGLGVQDAQAQAYKKKANRAPAKRKTNPDDHPCVSGFSKYNQTKGQQFWCRKAVWASCPGDWQRAGPTYDVKRRQVTYACTKPAVIK